MKGAKVSTSSANSLARKIKSETVRFAKKRNKRPKGYKSQLKKMSRGL